MPIPSRSLTDKSLRDARAAAADKLRGRIVAWMRQLGAPIRGGELAKGFHVSRQCLVQEIAILRASGEQIIATPRGNCLLQAPLIRIVQSLPADRPQSQPRKNFRFWSMTA
jgi:HTH domain